MCLCLKEISDFVAYISLVDGAKVQGAFPHANGKRLNLQGISPKGGFCLRLTCKTSILPATASCCREDAREVDASQPLLHYDTGSGLTVAVEGSENIDAWSNRGRNGEVAVAQEALLAYDLASR